jgi:hypothetical protein
MRTIDANALSGSARDTAGSTSSFANVVHCLVKDLFSGYRPELHYMRGPGPKWRAHHQPCQRSISEAVPPSGRHELSSVSNSSAEQSYAAI